MEPARHPPCCMSLNFLQGVRMLSCMGPTLLSNTPLLALLLFCKLSLSVTGPWSLCFGARTKFLICFRGSLSNMLIPGQVLLDGDAQVLV